MKENTEANIQECNAKKIGQQFIKTSNAQLQYKSSDFNVST